MNFLTKLLGVDKIVENQNRMIRLLGEEIDSLRQVVEEHMAEQVGVDPEGSGESWLDRDQAKKELHDSQGGG